jgi:hypothetical protein
MFQYYCVILGELILSTLLSYTSMSMQSLVIQYTPGQHNNSINIQTVYTAIIQDLMRIVNQDYFSHFIIIGQF